MNPPEDKITVLIVDDEPNGREVLETVLQPLGCQLFFTGTGQETLEYAAALIPDLILLDVMLPDIDGFEVCQRLRADVRLAEVPVLLVTALDDRDSRLRGIEVGADDFLTKPVDRAQLRMRVQTTMRMNRYRRLLTERKKFEVIAEHSQDAYVLLDAKNELLYANRQARAALGLDESSVAAGNFLELARARFQLQPAELWHDWPASSPGNGGPPLYLVKSETADEYAHWLQVEVLPMPADAVSSRLLRLRNVTEQLGHQRDMWKFQSLLSHKLCTPVVGLVGSLELLSDPQGGLTPEKMFEFAGLALASADRLNNQIQDILQFMQTPALARLQSAGFPLGDLADLVRKAADTLGVTPLTYEIEAGLAGQWLPFAPIAVETIFTEILENAKRFHPRQQPVVTVTVSAVNAGQVLLRVADDGMTLSPERLAQVWTPFYQGEKDFTGQLKGMGLGLSMVASLVWEKGGHCRMVNRQPGPGVVVELFLPLKQAQTAAARAAA